MSRYSIIPLALIITALFIIVSISTGYAAPEMPHLHIERHGERVGWRYRAALLADEGRISASVEYPVETAQHSNGLIITQKRMAQELIDSGIPSLEVQVVFRRPLTAAEFEHFVIKTGADVSGYTLRYRDNQGQRVTIIGGPDQGRLIPEDLLNIALDDLQQRASGQLLGWIQAQATVSAKNYAALRDHPQVFLVDVSRSAIRATFKDQADAANLPIDLISPQLYWKLEDLKLISQ